MTSSIQLLNVLIDLCNSFSLRCQQGIVFQHPGLGSCYYRDVVQVTV